MALSSLDLLFAPRLIICHYNLSGLTMLLHNRNIIRVAKEGSVANCIIVKMCYDYAVVKYEGKEYRIAYDVIDEVVGHELLVEV